MQEYHVTAAGRTYPLDQPFFVLATQNPIELEGTYPLPEAQLDRFMFNIVITYLTRRRRGAGRDADDRRRRPAPARVLTGPDILQFQELARQVRDCRRDRALRGAAGRRLAAGRARRSRVHREVGEVGRRPARVAGARPRRQGARADARPLSRLDQGHPGAGQADPAPPDHDRTSTPSRSASTPTRSSSGCSKRCRCRRAGCSDGRRDDRA